MPNFRYQVIDAAGKTSTGVIDAASMADASRKLRADGKFVASLKLDKCGVTTTIASSVFK